MKLVLCASQCRNLEVPTKVYWVLHGINFEARVSVFYIDDIYISMKIILSIILLFFFFMFMG